MNSPVKMVSQAEPAQANRFRPISWQTGGIVLLLLTGAALWRFLPQNARPNPILSSSESGATRRAVAVTTRSATYTDIPLWLEATGTVRAEYESAVVAKVMGRVQKVTVREGDTVRKGQPLIFLEASDLEASVAQARANLRAAGTGYESARVAARMEEALSSAHIAEARAAVVQSEAALQAATAKRDLVQAGPRRQEREQAAQAVFQAKSRLTLADSNLKRMEALYREGAISGQQFDQFQAQYEEARAQFETAQQGKSLMDEGSRAEEIRSVQQAVLQAQAAVREARATLQSAQAGALQAEVKQQEVLGAQAHIAQSQAGLQMATVTRGYAVLPAPFDGLVAQRLADPGVMAGPGVSLLKIQGGALRLEAVVPESALVSVRKGMPVPVRFDALRGRTLSGRVIEIAPQGDAGSHTFVVKIDLPLRSGVAAGMFGRARFILGRERRLPVPASAVFEREGLRYLYVVDSSNTAHLRMITVGEKTPEGVVVLSGLKPGERIVTAGQEALTDGTPITERVR